ncbi:MAG: hypothetical protein RJA44_695 [Pseudomonadota bacterium]|jgi:CBS domain-containing protein
MSNVAQMIRSKAGQAVQTTTPGASVREVMQLMAEHRIGGLPVVEGGQIVGIVTERDIVRKVELQGRTAAATAVRDIMTAPVMYVGPERTTQECMALMTERRLRHLPVLDGGQLVGLISIGDLVKDIISEQEFMIQQLQSYIQS